LLRLLQHLRSYRGNIKKFKLNFAQLPQPERPWQYFGEWSKSLRNGRSPMVDRKPWVTIAALHWLEKSIKKGWQVFEYGMGGSTLFFLDKGCHVVSVEHHKGWYDQVSKILKSTSLIKSYLEEPSAQNLNPVYESQFKKWKGMNFESYVRVAETLPDQRLDLALVDGRARNQCIVAIMDKVKPGGFLLLDNSERSRYQAAIEMLQQAGWTTTHFAGPGFYEQGAFWCTSLFQKPRV